MNQNQSFNQRVLSIIQQIDLDTEFYSALFSDNKTIQKKYHNLFFNFSKLDKQNEANPLTQETSNTEYLKNVNNGMNYTFIFDYTGASQEFKYFDILNRGINLQGRGSTKEDIKNFVYYPEDNEIYNNVITRMSWAGRTQVRITDDSSMAVCLNDAVLYENWQLQFQINMVDWVNGYRFSPGNPIGLGGNIAQSLRKIQNMWRGSDDKKILWVFQDELTKFYKDKGSYLFKDGSGNGALIRSAGLFEFYIFTYKYYISNGDLTQKDKFDKLVEASFMLDQYDQSTLTHSGLQAQVSILLLAYIQIQLLMKQLDPKQGTNERILQTEIKDLVNQFEIKYLQQILQKFTKFEVKLTTLQEQIRIFEASQEESKTKGILRYLNVNTNFDGYSIEETAFNSFLILYYQLFYKNKNGEYMWEDTDFIQYLAQKRVYGREGTNKDIYNPINNSHTHQYSLLQYEDYLEEGDSGYFGAYSPDCMSLIFNLIFKTDQTQNQDMLDYLYKVSMCKGDCDSHGAVLATVLAAFDLNYHLNYINETIQQRNNPLSHLDRMKLQKSGFLKDILSQVERMFFLQRSYPPSQNSSHIENKTLSVEVSIPYQIIQNQVPSQSQNKFDESSICQNQIPILASSSTFYEQGSNTENKIDEVTLPPFIGNQIPIDDTQNPCQAKHNQMNPKNDQISSFLTHNQVSAPENKIEQKIILPSVSNTQTLSENESIPSPIIYYSESKIDDYLCYYLQLFFLLDEEIFPSNIDEKNSNSQKIIQEIPPPLPIFENQTPSVETSNPDHINNNQANPKDDQMSPPIIGNQVSTLENQIVKETILQTTTFNVELPPLGDASIPPITNTSENKKEEKIIPSIIQNQVLSVVDTQISTLIIDENDSNSENKIEEKISHSNPQEKDTSFPQIIENQISSPIINHQVSSLENQIDEKNTTSITQNQAHSDIDQIQPTILNNF